MPPKRQKRTSGIITPNSSAVKRPRATKAKANDEPKRTSTRKPGRVPRSLPIPSVEATSGVSTSEEIPPTLPGNRQQPSTEPSDNNHLRDTTTIDIAEGNDDSTQGRSSTSVQPSVSLDPINRLANVLEQTLKSVRESSLSNGNLQLVNRITMAKSLPSFSGDPLEWLNFKEVYQSSTESGGYSDRENAARLFEVLKGEARETVAPLLATTRNPKEIMDALDMRYGDEKTIAENIASDLRKLPSITSGRVTLAQLSTKLRNAVITFKNFDLPGYLYHPDLIKSIGSKMPNSLKYAYSQSKKITKTVIFDVDRSEETLIENHDSKPKNQRRAKVNAMYNNKLKIKRLKNKPSDKIRNAIIYECAVCKKGKHHPMECAELLANNPEKRWVLARRNKLCFNCLKFGHPRTTCRSEGRCSQCRNKHHSLLHTKESNGNSNECTREAEQANTAAENSENRS